MILRATANNRLKSVVGGSIGNLIEWFDWYVYAAFSLYFSRHFFPYGNRTIQLLNVAAVFAVGFVMRPIGAWLMGIYADHRGRKAALTWSVALMSLGSLIIALSPGYEQIGIAAPLFLVIARMMQGISVGGEYGTSATYLSEIVGKKHRGFFSSFQCVTLVFGQQLAIVLLIVLQTFMKQSTLESWGWRIPFAIGAILAILVFWLRRNISETKSFERQEKDKSSILTLITHYPKETALAMFLTSGGTLAFYTYSIYMQKFLVNTSGFSREGASQINAITLFLFMCLQPIAGALSDKIGRKPLMVAFGTAGVLFTYSIFSKLAQTHNSFTAGLLVMAALIIVTGYTSVNALVKAELFPSHTRALGVAFPHALATTFFGGTAEYVALSFKKAGWESGFYWYVTFMIAISLIVYLCMRETRQTSQI
ncbi:MAG: Major transporter facilitator protein [Candidatus Tokpelaia sp. JSC161]|jgi:MHS family alpha-ketoglutarate permease-like MFS transporter|nr:MAG: Major transporter facilitator protein [Candidatus Tokpelaia sp. JSC161]